MTEYARPNPTLSVVHEQLVVGKTLEEVGALRVRIETDECDQQVALERVEDEVVVERVTVGREVPDRREPWMDGSTLVVPVYAQVPVVALKLMLVEELRLDRQARRSTSTETVPVRRERAVIERRQDDGAWRVIDVPLQSPRSAATPSDFPPTPEGALR